MKRKLTAGLMILMISGNLHAITANDIGVRIGIIVTGIVATALAVVSTVYASKALANLDNMKEDAGQKKYAHNALTGSVGVLGATAALAGISTVLGGVANARGVDMAAGTSYLATLSSFVGLLLLATALGVQNNNQVTLIDSNTTITAGDDLDLKVAAGTGIPTVLPMTILSILLFLFASWSYPVNNAP